ncbi:hypothetical protein [Pandoraea sp. XY-2]|uniref:hypothetical protein n=1 Tax=Pandoraea sp. XY-2 TaxID=2518599 RepID=UPI001021E762|nr:hypothetical protein [Pandoraea sp. XY-2]
MRDEYREFFMKSPVNPGLRACSPIAYIESASVLGWIFGSDIRLIFAETVAEAETPQGDRRRSGPAANARVTTGRTSATSIKSAAHSRLPTFIKHHVLHRRGGPSGKR